MAKGRPKIRAMDTESRPLLAQSGSQRAPSTFRLRLLARTGPYVSGSNRTTGIPPPAIINATQNTHRHDNSAAYPDIIGLSCGPNVVMSMKKPIAVPRSPWSSYISEYNPPSTAFGAAACIPHKDLKTSREAYVGASAHAIVKMV